MIIEKVNEILKKKENEGTILFIAPNDERNFEKPWRYMTDYVHNLTDHVHNYIVMPCEGKGLFNPKSLQEFMLSLFSFKAYSKTDFEYQSWEIMRLSMKVLALGSLNFSEVIGKKKIIHEVTEIIHNKGYIGWNGIKAKYNFRNVHEEDISVQTRVRVYPSMRFYTDAFINNSLYKLYLIEEAKKSSFPGSFQEAIATIVPEKAKKSFPGLCEGSLIAPEAGIHEAILKYYEDLETTIKII